MNPEYPIGVNFQPHRTAWLEAQQSFLCRMAELVDYDAKCRRRHTLLGHYQRRTVPVEHHASMQSATPVKVRIVAVEQRAACQTDWCYCVIVATISAFWAACVGVVIVLGWSL